MLRAFPYNYSYNYSTQFHAYLTSIVKSKYKPKIAFLNGMPLLLNAVLSFLSKVCLFYHYLDAPHIFSKNFRP